MSEVVSLLATWTPFLLIGFFWNIAVTALAVLIGTVVGVRLASMRYKDTGVGAKAGSFLSKVFRNVPTLALLFYAVFVLPREFTVYGTSIVVTIPLWFKAGLGLSGSIIGFTSESLLIAYKNMERCDYDAALLFIPTWGSSVMISFVASSTASLVGVSELISRSNSIIAATGTAYMIPVYLYTASFFVMGCLLWMGLIRRLKGSTFVRSLPQRFSSQSMTG